MITQIVMSPPTRPISEPAPSTASPSTNAPDSSSLPPTDPTTPANFKQALHSARGKHKTAPTPQGANAPAKKLAPAATKIKATPPQPTDDEDQADPAKPTTASGEEAAETLVKSPATPPKGVQSTKQTDKKDPAQNADSDTEPSETDSSPTEQSAHIVQQTTPDTPQPRGGKQQKSKEKSPQKPDASPVAAATVSVLSPSISSNHDIGADPKSAPKSGAGHPVAMGDGQPGIKPRATRASEHAALQTTASNSDTAAVVASGAAASQVPPDADSSDDASAPAGASAPSLPTPHAAVAISSALDALATIAPVHSTESPVASAPVSPTRAFAEANQDQIVTTIKGQLLPDGGSMQITLHPVNLGHVHISVQVTGGSVSATFETTSDQATRLLSHSLGQLKQTLESAGVTVEKLQVTQTRDSQPQAQSDSRQSPQQQQQTATDQRSSQQEKQRQEILQKMWDKIAGSKDWIDVKA